MSSLPSKQQLLKTLIDAAKSHHEFQSNYLDGVRHEQWAWWYSAYLLGRLGEFTTPTQLTKWLSDVTDKNSWFKAAAEHISLKVSNDTGSD
jgi:hypothetical protein